MGSANEGSWEVVVRRRRCKKKEASIKEKSSKGGCKGRSGTGGAGSSAVKRDNRFFQCLAELRRLAGVAAVADSRRMRRMLGSRERPDAVMRSVAYHLCEQHRLKKVAKTTGGPKKERSPSYIKRLRLRAERRLAAKPTTTPVPEARPQLDFGALTSVSTAPVAAKLPEVVPAVIAKPTPTAEKVVMVGRRLASVRSNFRLITSSGREALNLLLSTKIPGSAWDRELRDFANMKAAFGDMMPSPGGQQVLTWKDPFTGYMLANVCADALRALDAAGVKFEVQTGVVDVHPKLRA